MDRRQHWDTVYATKGDTETSWFQPEPRLSLDLIQRASPARGRVVDIGGGASLLVDRLLDRGYPKVAVLDISSAALEKSKARLGNRAGQVEWTVADVTAVRDIGQFDVWHDRAVFHFLTDAGLRRNYVELAMRTIPVGGHLVIGTFANDGPQKCSGLDVCRYDAPRLAAELGGAFELTHQTAHEHVTPWGKPQQFFFGIFRRV
jgi:SAM-dependent methyltransferase